MKLSEQDQQELEQHLQAIAKILYSNTAKDKLDSFEHIETTIREQVQTQISPKIGEFFFSNQPNQNRQK